MYALKRHWVCFLCRKQIRQPIDEEELAALKQRGDEDRRPCPLCHKPMFDMGRFFRPPRRHDHSAWYELWSIAEHGTRFSRASLHAYHRMLFGRTDRLKARDVIRNCSCRYPSNPGERLLVTIARRMRRRKVAR